MAGEAMGASAGRPTSPPHPSSPVGAGTGLALIPMAGRRSAIASNSSMNPMAPPYWRAALRRALKKLRTFRCEHPACSDWKDVGGGHQERDAGLLGQRLGRVRLAGAGRPSKSTPRRGRPPISRANVRCARNRFRVRTTSALTMSMPTTSSRPTSICSGRTTMCGERPPPTDDCHDDEQQEEEEQPRHEVERVDRRQVDGGPTGSPVSTRHHIQTSSGASSAAMPHSRRRRVRSRAAPTSAPRNGVGPPTEPSSWWVASGTRASDDGRVG